MNREIKFRAWHKNTRHFHYFGYPNTSSAFWAEVWDDKCPLTQFTGLKDKNGKEIYEGDIVTFRLDYLPDITRVGTVGFSEFRASFSIILSEHANNDLYKYVQNGNTAEVVGNIYENPELLEQMKAES